MLTLTTCMTVITIVIAAAGTDHAAEPESSLLSGPSVEPERPTLVQTTMMGQFQRVEGRPESAAIAAIEPGPDITDHAREIALDRTVALSVHLIDEIDTLREMTDAQLDGDQEAARAFFEELHESFDPELEHDPLSGQITRLLTPEQSELYTGVLEEYWDAWINAEIQNPRRRENPQVRANKRAELTQRLFQRELRDAYDISIKRTREAMEAIYNAVDPTPEQRETIRSIVIDHLKRTRLDATPAQRRETMHAIYTSLDDERRQKLFGYTLQAMIPNTDG